MKARVSATLTASHVPANVGPLLPARRRPRTRDLASETARSVAAEQAAWREPAEHGVHHDLGTLSILGLPTPFAADPDAAPDRERQPGDQRDAPTRLIDRAVVGPAAPLPHRAVIERRLGHSLADVEVFNGPEARAALRQLGARAATRGRQILFAEPEPALATVAHEAIHVLQGRGDGSGNAAVTGEDAAVEVEAERLAGEIAAAPDYLPAEPLAIAGDLATETVSLQRATAEPPTAGGAAVAERALAEFDTAVAEPPAAEAPTADAAAPAAPEAAAEREALPAATEAEAGVGVLDELPPAPEPGVSAEDVAAREAAIAEAEAILAAARDVDGLMDAFAAAPPTVKAREQGQLGQRTNELAQQETQQFQDGLPDLHAELNTPVEPVAPLTVEAPAAEPVTLEPTPPGPAPEPEIPATLDLGAYTANEDVSRGLNYGLAEETADRAEQIGESLADVQTTDPDTPRAAGPPPAIPLGGETDLERLANQAGEGLDQARGARDEARTAVLAGPGPEQAQPQQLDEVYAVDALAQPTVVSPAANEGAQAYLTMGLPPEVETAFDQEQQAAMQASMAGARDGVAQATQERDQSRQAEVDFPQSEADRLSREADTSQRDRVIEARETIQRERQATLDGQTQAVTDLETNVYTRRRADHEAVDTRVRDDQAKIDDRYRTADADIETEVGQGERDAADERRKAERAAEEESWWDRAVGFVRDAFNALVGAIDTIFAAVRAAVNDILDAVKSFAMELIDAAANFIKGAIAAFGDFLKGAVDALLGDIFPDLAAKLNQAIDDAVVASQQFVDDVATGLKAGVAALVDGLKAGLNRILDVFQAGLQVALALVEAALTGDWSALARKLLEAVLKVAGIAPETFYAFIGRAEETFQLILDDPAKFVGNLLDAFLGGVRRFADNFLTHLQAGIVGWLTGTLGGAGITPPERFDLMGVLDLARQILGLTWERLRQKAARLIGEQNVARLEFIGSYIQNLVAEGWSALWTRIGDDVAALRDQVLEGIKSFLLERVIVAAIPKIASLFNPVGAIVQLVLAAWNLYTFLRDQLQRIAQVVQTVIEAIANIARGILEPAMARVETVLASLLPLALDLLARLLGLGNVGAKVREIVERIQGTIDRAIDKLIQRVLAAFRGDRGAGDGQVQADAARLGVTPEADPDVKRAALDDVQSRLRGKGLRALPELRAVMAETVREFKPRGLKSLDVDITNEATMETAIDAAASEPERRSFRWAELFEPEDPEQLLFATQPRNETHAAISVNARRIGEVVTSKNGRHAEQNLVAAHWAKALQAARESAAQEGAGRAPSTTLAIAINRAPCHNVCSPLLTGVLEDVEPGLKPRVRFILAPTGTYEPTKRLTPEEIEQRRDDLRKAAAQLGPPGRAVILEWLATVPMTSDTTTFNDLRRLSTAGWDIAQLLARPEPTTAGIVFAEAAHKIAVEADRIEVKS